MSNQSVEIKSLHVYPVKSCAGIDLEEAQIGTRGFQYDRNWMIVEPDGTKITQRDNLDMARIRTSLTDGELILEYEGRDPLHIDLATEPTSKIEVDIWGHRCIALEEGERSAQWLSSIIQKEVCLARFDPDHIREVGDTWDGGRGDHTGFADMLPFLITANESLDALNDLRKEDGLGPSPMSRFRPNIVIEGAGPFAEESIGGLQLPNGHSQIDLVRLCSRCQITNVDQVTGEKEGQGGNHKLLHKQRLLSNLDGKKAGMFGVQAIGTGTEGEVLHVGDILTPTTITPGMPSLPNLAASS